MKAFKKIGIVTLAFALLCQSVLAGWRDTKTSSDTLEASDWNEMVISSWNGDASAIYRASGDVGIGITIPTAALDIVGDLKVGATFDLFVDDSADRVGIGTSTPGAYKLDVNGTANMTVLSIGGAAVTSTATELNILDGVTATTAELNFIGGVTSAIQTQLDVKEGTLTNSAGLASALSDETGTGGLAVFNASPTIATPTITTSATAPLLIGGIGTTSDLSLQTTSEVGATGADMHFLVGNAGGTEAMTILNSGYVGIGTTAPTAALDVDGSIIASGNLNAGTYSGGGFNANEIIYSDGTDLLGNDSFKWENGVLKLKKTSGNIHISPSGISQEYFSNTAVGIQNEMVRGRGTAANPEKVNDNSSLFEYFPYAQTDSINVGIMGRFGMVMTNATGAFSTWAAKWMFESYKNGGEYNTFELRQDETEFNTLFNDVDLIINGDTGELARFDASTGNVGIGTTAPAVELDVAGTIHVTGTGAQSAIFTSTQGTTAANMVAAQMNMESDGSTNAAVLIGFTNKVRHSGSNATVTTMIAGQNRIQLGSSTTGTTTVEYGTIGLQSIFDISGSNARTYDLNNGYTGLMISSTIGAATGLVDADQYKGITITNPAPDGTPLTVSGDLIGIQIAKQTGASGNNYGIVLDGEGTGADIVFGDTQDARIYLEGSGAGDQNLTLDAVNGDDIVLTGGNVGIGTTAPTAALHLKAGTATASTAPLKLTSGTSLTTAEAGAMEFNGTDLFFTPSSTRKTIAFMSDVTAGAGISNVAEDTAPQLGANLDVNGKSIVSVSDGDIAIAPNGVGDFYVNTNDLYVDTSVGYVGIGTTEPAAELDVVGTINASAFSGGGFNVDEILHSDGTDIVGSSNFTWENVYGTFTIRGGFVNQTFEATGVDNGQGLITDETRVGRFTSENSAQGGFSVKGYSNGFQPATQFSGTLGSNTPAQSAITFNGFKVNAAKNAETALGDTEALFKFQNANSNRLTINGRGDSVFESGMTINNNFNDIDTIINGDSSEVMRIDASTDRIGIGLNTPVAKLDVLSTDETGSKITTIITGTNDGNALRSEYAHAGSKVSNFVGVDFSSTMRGSTNTALDNGLLGMSSIMYIKNASYNLTQQDAYGFAGRFTLGTGGNSAWTAHIENIGALQLTTTGFDNTQSDRLSAENLHLLDIFDLGSHSTDVFSSVTNAGGFKVAKQTDPDGKITNIYGGWMAGDGLGADITFGAGHNAKIYYDSANLIIDPRVVGTGILDVRSGAVFNEDGEDTDFRVEGDTEQNLLFVDASTDRVGIGTTVPTTALHVSGTVTATLYEGSGANLINIPTELSNDATPQLGGDLDVNGKSIVSASNGNILLMPNGTGNVGIGTATPLEKLDVKGQRILIGADDVGKRFGDSGFSGTMRMELGYPSQDDLNPVAIVSLVGSGNNIVTFGQGLAGSYGATVMGFNTFETKTSTTGSRSHIWLGGGATPQTKFNAGLKDIDTIFYGDTSEVMRIDASTHKVGIGTAVPGTTLEVDGTYAFTPSGITSLLEAGALTVTDGIMYVDGSGGAVTLVSTPNIVAGTEGQCVTIFGNDAVNTLTFQDEDNLPNSGLALAGDVNAVLGLGDNIELCYTTLNLVAFWREKSRSLNIDD